MFLHHKHTRFTYLCTCLVSSIANSVFFGVNVSANSFTLNALAARLRHFFCQLLTGSHGEIQPCDLAGLFRNTHISPGVISAPYLRSASARPPSGALSLWQECRFLLIFCKNNPTPKPLKHPREKPGKSHFITPLHALPVNLAGDGAFLFLIIPAGTNQMLLAMRPNSEIVIVRAENGWIIHAPFRKSEFDMHETSTSFIEKTVDEVCDRVKFILEKQKAIQGDIKST